ncbi:restriction endonuclease type II-like protein [Blastocladiella britannica]|nr:restriction endonuclease type II-like protein [Blastocladiella britannica]
MSQPPRRRFVVPGVEQVYSSGAASSTSAPPRPPPLAPPLLAPPSTLPPPTRSIYHEGARPPSYDTSSSASTSTSGNGGGGGAYMRKRRALEDEDLFVLPDMPGFESTSSSSSVPAAPAVVHRPVATTVATGNTTAAPSNSIIVNGMQRGNPVLEHLRTVAWEYGASQADYVVGRTAGVLFLSVKYHRLKQDYIAGRIRAMAHAFDLRILLVLVDVSDHQSTIRELSRLCIQNDLTMLVATSNEECARYLEMYKLLESRPAESLQPKQQDDYMSRLTALLTQIKGVNKTDVLTLSAHFGCVRRIVEASEAELSSLAGIGDKKATRIHKAFRSEFFGSRDTIPMEDDDQA